MCPQGLHISILASPFSQRLVSQGCKAVRTGRTGGVARLRGQRLTQCRPTSLATTRIRRQLRPRRVRTAAGPSQRTGCRGTSAGAASSPLLQLPPPSSHAANAAIARCTGASSSSSHAGGKRPHAELSDDESSDGGLSGGAQTASSDSEDDGDAVPVPPHPPLPPRRTASADGDGDGDDAAAGAGAGAGAAQRRRAASTTNKLLTATRSDGRLHDLNVRVAELHSLQPDGLFEHFEFPVAHFLHLAAGGHVHTPADALPGLDHNFIQLRPGVHLFQRLDDRRVQLGGRVLLGNALQCAERLDCVAIAGLEESGRATTWYAQLVMSFAATYRGRRLELCYVRWLHTAAAVAAAARRELTEAERRGPFEAYRWAVHPPTRARGHPRAGSAWFGVVRPCEIKYRVHMCPSLDDAALFRLNTDVWEYM